LPTFPLYARNWNDPYAVLNHIRQMRQALLIALMAFTLVGVQLAQASPLHNHVQHSVDCALCHLQLGDDVVVRVQVTAAFIPNAAPQPVTPAPFYSFTSPSPYQGRAPPVLFS
jgi:hypothetical protein